MITPNEIKEYCLRMWKEILVSSIHNNLNFPIEITRTGRINSKDILQKLSAHIESTEILKLNSKAYKKWGYSIVFEDRQFEKIGKQTIPHRILIETLEDYLKLTSKEKEYEIFKRNLQLIQFHLPRLLNWVTNHPLKLIEHNTWSDTLQVCKYFIDHPKPYLYIRQLPIAVHTKYIQENKGIVQSLLEYLIAEHINKTESRFELRFHLKYAEPLIRVRFLDAVTYPIPATSDVSFTLTEFHLFNTQCANVFVTENLMNFLTLPRTLNTIAIWSGGGFHVSHLKEIEWLKHKQFYYWGDLDAQGFQILNQFRTYFPSTVAIMMDFETLGDFEPGVGEPCTKQNLKYLTETELEVYHYLMENNLRLEQEKITQLYSEAKIASLDSFKFTTP